MPAFRPRAKGRLKPPRSLGAEVQSLARDLGLEGGLKLHHVHTKWRGLFNNGPLSLHTWPGHLSGGRLTIYADSPPWLQQASFLRQDILTKLRPFGVSELTFRIGRSAPRRMQDDGEEDVRTRELSDQDAEAIEDTVSALTDPELRDTVRRAMRAWARRRHLRGGRR